jgi:cytochrome c-type biogenesis protein CcmH
MSGWISLILLSAATFGILIRLGKIERQSWFLVGAVIVLAMAGYAYQGRPSLPAAEAKPIASNSNAAKALIETRSEMDFTFSRAKPYLVTSDAFARDGDYSLAVSYIKSGIRKNPQDANLWSGLGLQLMLASDGKMSPPAQYAFDQARKYGPDQPAPDYFAGLSLLFDGQPDQALKLWQGVLARSPENAKWRPRLESQISGLQMMQKRMRDDEALPSQEIE